MSPTGTGIEYSGITTQAPITDVNAEGLATGAYIGGALAGSMSPGVVSWGGGMKHPRYFNLAETLETAVVQVDVTAPTGVVAVGGIQEFAEETIPGDCGGSATYSMNLNEVTGDFLGSMEFIAFCSGSVTISGSASFSGSVDLITSEFLEFSLSFSSLTTTSDSDSFTVSGDITFNYQTSPATATMDILMPDSTSGKVYWVNNYSLTIEDTGAFVDFTVSGRFYDPDYGWVDIGTTTNFQISVGQEYPYQGVLVLDGTGGTQARLTALSSTTYEVEADTDGDGNYDWGPVTSSWP